MADESRFGLVAFMAGKKPLAITQTNYYQPHSAERCRVTNLPRHEEGVGELCVCPSQRREQHLHAQRSGWCKRDHRILWKFEISCYDGDRGGHIKEAFLNSKSPAMLPTHGVAMDPKGGRSQASLAHQPEAPAWQPAQPPALSKQFVAGGRAELTQRCPAGPMGQRNTVGRFVCGPFHVGLSARMICGTTPCPVAAGGKCGIGGSTKVGRPAKGFEKWGSRRGGGRP